MAYRDDHDAAVERIGALEHELKQADAERKQAEAERDRVAAELARERRVPGLAAVGIAARTPAPVKPLTQREIEWLHQDLRKAGEWGKAVGVVGLVALSVLALGAILIGLLCSNDARLVGLVLGGIISIPALIQLRAVRADRRSHVLDIVCASPDRIRGIGIGVHDRNHSATLTIRIDTDEQLVLFGNVREMKRLHERLHRLHVEALPHLLPSGERAPPPGSG